MASFVDCIIQQAAKGVITDEQKTGIITEYHKQVAKYERSMDPLRAKEQAAIDIGDHVVNTVGQAKANLLQQAVVNQRNLELINTSGLAPGKAESILMQRALDKKKAYAVEFKNVGNEVYKATRGGFFGLSRNIDAIKDGLRFIRDGNSLTTQGSIIGKSVGATFEAIHERYRQLGGIMGKLNNFTPQIIDANTIRRRAKFGERVKGEFNVTDYKKTKKEFIDDVVNEADHAPFKDYETGRQLDADEIRNIAADIFDTMINDGLPDGVPGKGSSGNVRGGRKFNERRNYTRVLHWKDSDAFFRMNEKWGVGDKGLPALIERYIQGMSHDIAMMETFGPDFYSGLKAIERNMDLAPRTMFSRTRITHTKKEMKTLMGLGGESSQLWWQAFEASAHYLRFTHLGSAVVPAMGDSVFSMSAAALRGHSVSRSFYNWMRGIVSKNHGEIGNMRNKLGYAYETIYGNMMADARFMGDFGGDGLFAGLAHAGMVATGLNRVTVGAKDGAALEAIMSVGEKLDKPWDKLSKPFKEGLEIHGIGPAEWEIMQTHGAWDTPYGKDVIKRFDIRTIAHASDDNPAFKMLMDAANDAYTRGGFMGYAGKLVNGKLKRLGNPGLEMAAYHAGKNWVAKLPSGRTGKNYTFLNKNWYDKRFAMESVLADAGVIPKVFRIQLDNIDGGNPKFVRALEKSGGFITFQEKVTIVSDYIKKEYGEYNSKTLKMWKDANATQLKNIVDKLEDLGFVPRDFLDNHNIGRNVGIDKDGNPKIIDVGLVMIGEKRGQDLDLLGRNLPDKFKEKLREYADKLNVEENARLAKRKEKNITGFDEYIPNLVKEKHARKRAKEAKLTDEAFDEFIDDTFSANERDGISNKTIYEADQKNAIAREYAKQELYKLKMNFLTYLEDYRSLAVNEPTLTTMAYQTGGYEVGTLQRAGRKAWTMFQGFPLTVFHRHTIPAIQRVLNDPANIGSYKSLSIQAGLGTMIGYHLILPLSDIIRGKTPVPPEERDWRYTAKSFAVVGAGGPIASALLSDTSYFGSNPLKDAFVGPYFGNIFDAYVKNKNLLDVEKEWEDGEFSEAFMKRNMSTLKRHVPFATTWYLRLALQRLLIDGIESAIDPDWDEKQNKVREKMNEKTGQDWWWAPGEDPDIEKLQESVEDTMLRLGE